MVTRERAFPYMDKIDIGENSCLLLGGARRGCHKKGAHAGRSMPYIKQDTYSYRRGAYVDAWSTDHPEGKAETGLLDLQR
jgi:hypothetical protein